MGVCVQFSLNAVFVFSVINRIGISKAITDSNRTESKYQAANQQFLTGQS